MLYYLENAQAVEKIGRSCFIKFTPEYVSFGAIHSPGDNDQTTGGGSIQCWSRLPKASLFLEYRVESKFEDEIYIEMKVEDLLLAMRTCSNASVIVMRMTGRSVDAYLSFNITSEDHLGNSRAIIQNVPIIKVLTADGASNATVFEEPMIPTPEVHIMLPHLERLRHVMASYKNLADYVVISANLSGEMVFTTSDGVQHQFNGAFHNNNAGGDEKMEDIAPIRYGMAEKAHVETRFTNLHNPDMKDDDEGDYPHEERLRDRPKEFASVLVKVLDLQKVLQSHYVKPSNVICSIVPNHCILFYVYMKKEAQEATLTYFIPEIAS
ncbi:hypothetical protein BGX26_008839 [Mortierella sp. AD094]|nr:hypothetical protein BGX26_008839 [Mortierella sp. AD094]